MRRYYSFNQFLRERFGERVQKVPLDAGFTCPNRDGTKGHGGCIYCNAYGSGTGAFRQGISVREQMLSGMEKMARRYGARKFLAYFQAFSNTYGPPEVLRARYEEALVDERVVGLCVGTRPDCVNEEVAEVLAEFESRGLMVWVELGLQSVHNETLARIRRGHTFEDFLAALEILKRRPLLVCVHLIFGLPGEGPLEMLETVRKLAELPVDGIKFHELYVVRGSALEALYRQGHYRPLTQGEYADLVAEAIAHLPPRVVIQRLTGDPRPEELVAPDWARDKSGTRRLIEETLLNRGLYQGKYLS
ncbi:TIGR01212 family radical SAM protein [Thermosulfurimonas marina]|uniref:TIGR01212 family radical SAM protein n=1 Tax=Thermosulfurimonas marina TaxID=2047767 RepID=A0A6H1WSZ0_9BACT|nr:TIGR01212 family radical SAM protein [Thermosulfurimonas marina]QJA06290.1 TIGR01212 family radical SAM protein [Thermosulfurimonas marina]